MFKKLTTYLIIIVFHAGLLSNPAMAFYYESSFGLQTNLPINLSGGGGALNSAVDSILHPSGSTTITQVNKGSEKEQETRATVGEGEIIIGGKEVSEENGNTELLASLNRD
jgi:hypothetical protein